MLTHDHIWQSIDRLAQAHGYSPSGLAKKAGLDPTTFNKSKRVSADGKPRWPSTESIAKVLSVTGATMSEFLSLGEDRPATGGFMPDGAPIALRRKSGEVMTGLFIRQNAESVWFQAAPDDGQREIPKGEIEWMAHIVYGG